MRQEMAQRFGDAADILYRDVQDADVQANHSKIIEEIENRGLLYPVTVIGGMPVYDGAVSYPAILRAVGNKLAE
ncbi:MAG: DUF1462 family protein [Actinomycetota bacterium]|nr:DUF1462 family protein [Actinomycetota bacterium]